MIENLIQNPPPGVSPLEDIVRETQNNPSTNLCVSNPTPLHVKNIEFSPEKNLENQSIPIHFPREGIV